MRRLLSLFGLCSVMLLPSVLSAQQAPALPAIKQEAASEVDGLQTLTQQMVDQIFSFSELGFQEVETSRYVTGILEKNGFQVERGVAGIPTAWLTTYSTVKPSLGFITDLTCMP